MPVKRKILDAVEFLNSLKVGDPVTVSEGSRKMSPGLWVSRTARRSDGAFGSVESTQVTVTYGPGRYSVEIAADAIGSGRYTIARGCQQCAGSKWVCEKHGIHPSETTSLAPNACGEGAGMPCDICSPELVGDLTTPR